MTLNRVKGHLPFDPMNSIADLTWVKIVGKLKFRLRLLLNFEFYLKITLIIYSLCDCMLLHRCLVRWFCNLQLFPPRIFELKVTPALRRTRCAAHYQSIIISTPKYLKSMPTFNSVLPSGKTKVNLIISGVGDSGVGKTCLVKRFCEEKFTAKFHPTVGIDYGFKIHVIGDVDVRVHFWDMAGK